MNDTRHLYTSAEGQPIATDREGYLQELSDWNEHIALQIAASESIGLTDAHWEIIWAIKEFHSKYQHSPAMRPLVKHIKMTLGASKGNSLHLMTLFPPSPAKLCAKIAGLPRPANCL